MKIEHEQQVVAFTAGLPGLTISDLMEKYRTIEAKKKEVKEQLEFAEALLDAIENQMANYLIETQQDGSVTPFGVVKRVKKDTFYVEDKPMFHNWAVENGLEELMSISVTQKAMNAYVDDQYQDYLKAQVEAEKRGEVLPPFEVKLPDGINTKSEFKLSITKK